MFVPPSFSLTTLWPLSTLCNPNRTEPTQSKPVRPPSTAIHSLQYVLLIQPLQLPRSNDPTIPSLANPPRAPSRAVDDMLGSAYSAPPSVQVLPLSFFTPLRCAVSVDWAQLRQTDDFSIPSSSCPWYALLFDHTSAFLLLRSQITVVTATNSNISQPV
ncbi:hypothetical protein CALCODRAFT_187060 [Calocera cornea HHB12733]|uniref:Uncharacterized protein n=1 Tax=Calocera cornea HHB12733 TaxID=1353952 RepID=A0A165HPK3_9BASI|nr:hypothetical protein CALCODRAFT_187060 [Calocera cornea HHB12733]